MFDVGDLVLMQIPKITLDKWEQDEEYNTVAIVTSITAHKDLITGEPIFPYYYEIITIDGKKLEYMKEDRLQLLAKP